MYTLGISALYASKFLQLYKAVTAKRKIDLYNKYNIYSMIYTVNFGLCQYARFSQIQSQVWMVAIRKVFPL